MLARLTSKPERKKAKPVLTTIKAPSTTEKSLWLGSKVRPYPTGKRLNSIST